MRHSHKTHFLQLLSSFSCLRSEKSSPSCRQSGISLVLKIPKFHFPGIIVPFAYCFEDYVACNKNMFENADDRIKVEINLTFQQAVSCARTHHWSRCSNWGFLDICSRTWQEFQWTRQQLQKNRDNTLVVHAKADTHRKKNNFTVRVELTRFPQMLHSKSFHVKYESNLVHPSSQLPRENIISYATPKFTKKRVKMKIDQSPLTVRREISGMWKVALERSKIQVFVQSMLGWKHNCEQWNTESYVGVYHAMKHTPTKTIFLVSCCGNRVIFTFLDSSWNRTNISSTCCTLNLTRSAFLLDRNSPAKGTTKCGSCSQVRGRTLQHLDKQNEPKRDEQNTQISVALQTEQIHFL